MLNLRSKQRQRYRLGIDIGGTKIEIALLAVNGEGVFQCAYRHRMATPSTYHEILQTLVALITLAETASVSVVGSPLPVSDVSLGIGLPGKITHDGLIQNSNTQCLNHQSIQSDLIPLLPSYLHTRVALMNDANCFVLSEVKQGSARVFVEKYQQASIFGIIIGTGVGGGLFVNQQLLTGCNGIAGEWGHTTLPAELQSTEFYQSCGVIPSNLQQARPCYCGKYNCVETYLSGAGFVHTYACLSGLSHNRAPLTVPTILDRISDGDWAAQKSLDLYVLQLASAIAMVVNIVDPEVIVLGGGLSNIENLAALVEAKLALFVFSEDCRTRVLKAELGDSSGVFGAAWLG